MIAAVKLISQLTEIFIILLDVGIQKNQRADIFLIIAVHIIFPQPQIQLSLFGIYDDPMFKWDKPGIRPWIPRQFFRTSCHHNLSPSTQKSLVSWEPKRIVNAPVANTKMPNGVHFRSGGGS